MSRDGYALSTDNGPSKKQGGTLLPYLNYGFKSYHNTEWYQWELNFQLKATGATQCLEVENFPDTGKDAKDLLAYETTNNRH
eukprot:7741094-Ditylum_brightwellii.AAC.1